MRLFVYEYLTANGIGRAPDSPEHGMYLEGRAMRDALVEDFQRIPAVEVMALRDDSTPGEPDRYGELVKRADWTVVIAPETDGILVERAHAVRYAGGGLLGPSLDAIRLTSDKHALAQHWRATGVPTPATTDRNPTACEIFPVVWKPRDGAGSTDTFLIRDGFELARAAATRDPQRPMVLQEWIPGQPASTAFLCGPRGHVPLRPAFQLLSDDGRFKYQGGELPIPPELAARAVALAQRAVECVPGLLGYVGVDLVLGGAADGSHDYAIEINPRVTTSYIGLRALAEFNIAEAMLKMAGGGGVGKLRWRASRIRFGPEGAVGSL